MASACCKQELRVPEQSGQCSRTSCSRTLTAFAYNMYLQSPL
jgi:hypothetical protein